MRQSVLMTGFQMANNTNIGITVEGLFEKVG